MDISLDPFKVYPPVFLGAKLLRAERSRSDRLRLRRPAPFPQPITGSYRAGCPALAPHAFYAELDATSLSGDRAAAHVVASNPSRLQNQPAMHRYNVFSSKRLT
jgi:hypothetical protein